jgi:hypothetical protein
MNLGNCWWRKPKPHHYAGRVSREPKPLSILSMNAHNLAGQDSDETKSTDARSYHYRIQPSVL